MDLLGANGLSPCILSENEKKKKQQKKNPKQVKRKNKEKKRGERFRRRLPLAATSSRVNASPRHRASQTGAVCVATAPSHLTWPRSSLRVRHCIFLSIVFARHLFLWPPRSCITFFSVFARHCVRVCEIAFAAMDFLCFFAKKWRTKSQVTKKFHVISLKTRGAKSNWISVCVASLFDFAWICD